MSTLRTIRTLERIRNSKSGNPRYRVTFTDGSTARTVANTMWAYGIAPHLWEGQRVAVTFDSRGYIANMQRIRDPFIRETVNGKDVPLQTGCALDGHFGWHNTYRVVREIAQPFGFMITDEEEALLAAYEKQEKSLDLPTDHPHQWRQSRFAGNVTCSVCGLLPLDQDDIESECVLHYDESAISEAAYEIADDATQWLNDHTFYGQWIWDMGELFLWADCGHDDDEWTCPLGDECATHGLTYW